MKIFAGCLVCSTVLAASASAADFKFGLQTLTVPDGFEIEQVAGTNLVDRPVSMDFDEQGRLYVTVSSGSNDKVEKQLEEKPHRIIRLEDTDGDGRFDKQTLFADKLMFPEGAMWFDGSLYVSAPPSIWKFTDADGDGIAEKREEWFPGKTLTGCANDLHGPHLGPDGFIYWCKGAFAEQTYQVNGKPFTTKASHIFRSRPDGSRFEPVMTGGMDNPVGLAFSSTGERFLAGTFFEPQIPGQRDGVIHAIYGGVYGKPNAVLEGHKRTGDLMPVMIHLGPAASCSVISYRSGFIGEQYRDNLFVCNFNLHNVTRHILNPKGATFATEDHVFLSSDSTDFHPTCILEDADGSLLVIDTGGWYKICCPTSQLSKPDVFGAIYRIKRKGAVKIEDSRGLKIDWEKSDSAELAKLLDDERPFVVERAIRTLAKRGASSISALSAVLKNSSNEEARRNAVWALTRIDHPNARKAIRSIFPTGKNSTFNGDDSAIQTAIYSIGLWRDAGAINAPLPEDFPALIGMIGALEKENAFTRRAAAEAWGRIGVQKSMATDRLLGSPAYDANGLAKKPFDRVLEHSFAYALIELNEPGKTTKGLSNRFAQRIALIALDQMDNGNLKPEQVTPHLLSTNAQLKETATWIVSHHPEWGEALVGFFRERLKENLNSAQQAELEIQLAQFAKNPAIQNLISETLQSPKKSVRLIALRIIVRSEIKAVPSAWLEQISQALNSNDSEIINQAVLTARTISIPKEAAAKISPALLKIAGDASASVETRMNALVALPAGTQLNPALFEFLTANLAPEKSVSIRNNAATVLARATLSEGELLAICDALPNAGPMEVSKLLPVFEKQPSEKIGLKLVESLSKSKAVSSLRPENLKPLFAKFPASVQTQGASIIASLNVDAASQAKRVDELFAALKNGDVRRGQAVFNSAKAACSSCHTIGYGGGHVGPDLTRIGAVRTERDLLEAIAFPSASFVRSYEPMVVVLQSGDDYSGVIKRDAPDEIVLATGPGPEIKIARNEIAEIRPGNVSVMPGGLAEQLSEQELADLIAFLKAAR